jgi:hypothetical protein
VLFVLRGEEILGQSVVDDIIIELAWLLALVIIYRMLLFSVILV